MGASVPCLVLFESAVSGATGGLIWTYCLDEVQPI
jgi:hypothetical protein